MGSKDLRWTVENEHPICVTPVFTVHEQTEIPPEGSGGQSGKYVAVSAPDWAVIMPVMGDDFVMVRQWRHGEQRVTIEFPGGVCDPNEEPMVTAERELLEETGCKAGKLTCLGSMSSNPALFRNHVHFFLAEDLIPTGEQHLDSDEVLTYERVPIREAIANFGTGESTHAFTGTALMLYLRAKQK